MTSLDYSPTGRFVVSAADDGTITLWDLELRAFPFNLPIPHQCDDLVWNTVAFSPAPDDTISIIGASAKSGHVFTWEIAKGTWETREEFNVAQCPLSASSPEDSDSEDIMAPAYIAFTDKRTLCRIAEKVGLFKILHKTDTINPVSWVTLNTTTEWESYWDIPTSVSWSTDNSWIISGEVSGAVHCWDQRGQPQFTLYPHSTGKTSHAFFG